MTSQIFTHMREAQPLRCIWLFGDSALGEFFTALDLFVSARHRVVAQLLNRRLCGRLFVKEDK